MERESDLRAWRAGVDRQISAMSNQVSQNSSLLRSLSTKVTDIAEKIKPVLEAISTMEAGVRVLGILEKFGERFGKIVLLLVAMGVAAKFIIGTATWASVVDAFARMMR